MAIEQWILHVLLGGLLGVLGQGIRVVPGLKKVNDHALAEKKPFGDVFKVGELLISLFIGFTAGGLAIIATLPDGSAATTMDRQMILTLLAAGYAGTDFIEAFVKKNLPSDGGPKPATTAADAKPVAERVDNTPAMG
jgi:hypothetical protein